MTSELMMSLVIETGVPLKKLFIFTCFVSSFSITVSSSAQTLLEENTKLLGQDLSISQAYGSTPTGNGVQTTTDVKFMGKGVPLFEAVVVYNQPAASASPTPTSNPVTATDTVLNDLIQGTSHTYYVDGIRVWSDQASYQGINLSYTGKIPPTQISIPVLAYPLGPLVFELAAGISFEAELTGTLSPGVSFPIQTSTLTASIQALAGASGFVDGDVRLLVIRGGIRGTVNLITGDASVNALMYLNGQKPMFSYGGKVTSLGGSIDAFVDTHVFFGTWKNLITKNLYSWNGKCWAFGAETCSN